MVTNRPLARRGQPGQRTGYRPGAGLGQDELDKAVAAARSAFQTWKKTPIEERRAAIMAISGAIKENAEELYRLLTAEQGKPHDQAKGEIYGAAAMSARNPPLNLDDEINEDSDTRLSRTRRVRWAWSAGSCRGFPVMMAIQKIVPRCCRAARSSSSPRPSPAHHAQRSPN